MTRRLALLALAALAAACGSHPPREPAATSAPREALALGVQFYGDDDYASATQMFEKALELYRSVDDRAGAASAMVNLADAALVLGEPARALGWVEQGRALAAAEHDDALSTRFDLLQAQTLARGSRPADARPLLDSVLARAGTGADVQKVAAIERARVALASGEPSEGFLQEARRRVPATDAPRTRAALLQLEAEVARRASDPGRARTLLEQALALHKQGSYRPGIAACNEELGALALSTGDAAMAQDRYSRSLVVRLWLHDRAHSAADAEILAALAEQRGDRAASARYRAQLAVLRATGAVD